MEWKLGNLCKLDALETRTQGSYEHWYSNKEEVNKEMPTNQEHWKQGGRNKVNSYTLETGTRKQRNKTDL